MTDLLEKVLNCKKISNTVEPLIDALVSKMEVKPDDFANLLEHRHPNCLQFDEDGRLYVGDSLGAIHVWDIQVNRIFF